MPRYEYYVEPGDAIDIVNFDPNDRIRVVGTGADEAAKRLRKENERKGRELHSRQCSIDTLRTELSRRDSAITHRDKEIVKLEAKLSRRDSAVNQLENQIRALQGRRPFEYPHPPVGVNCGYTVTCTGHRIDVIQQPRFTRGGERQKMDGSFIFYLNKDGQHTAEFKSRGLRDRVVDDLNGED